jgi:hypothetical protein
MMKSKLFLVCGEKPVLKVQHYTHSNASKNTVTYFEVSTLFDRSVWTILSFAPSYESTFSSPL